MLHQFNENEIKQQYINQALTYGVPLKKHGNEEKFKSFVDYHNEKFYQKQNGVDFE